MDALAVATYNLDRPAAFFASAGNGVVLNIGISDEGHKKDAQCAGLGISDPDHVASSID